MLAITLASTWMFVLYVPGSSKRAWNIYDVFSQSLKTVTVARTLMKRDNAITQIICVTILFLIVGPDQILNTVSFILLHNVKHNHKYSIYNSILFIILYKLTNFL